MEDGLRERAQLLLASLPLLSGIPDLPPFLQPTTLPLIIASGNSPSPPEQGGQRITELWVWSLKDRDCAWRFHYTASEIFQMVEVLDIPDKFVTASRYSFPGFEAFCLLCAHF
ncbi:hypothetical protein JAAARDRAFT_52043 [Jaapia argillacea MUCL 33604]|uniref:Uncharacterized protein n=1 Tax=Jaapia argillacea MUCL 33604 TaxID=933084 RepID=A0A067QAD1_9AGAM|nr:hypothetical protein JAAARDRAFT_52043 [Jaapia argillacea MUCL 33604]